MISIVSFVDIFHVVTQALLYVYTIRVTITHDKHNSQYIANDWIANKRTRTMKRLRWHFRSSPWSICMDIFLLFFIPIVPWRSIRQRPSNWFFHSSIVVTVYIVRIVNITIIIKIYHELEFYRRWALFECFLESFDWQNHRKIGNVLNKSNI